MATEEEEILTDDQFETMLDAMEQKANSSDLLELLKTMNEHRIISVEEAERILETEGGENKVVKCGLPEHVRPSDPENRTDIELAISKLTKDDPTLVEVNINNMKRTPLPVIQKLIAAAIYSTHLKKLQLANVGLTDTGAEPLIPLLEKNSNLQSLNLETNYLSGDFLGRMFKATQHNSHIEEIKAVNQSMAFSTEAEKQIMEGIFSNRSLLKVSVDLRHPESKNKVDKGTFRNREIKRIARQMAKEAAAEAKDEPGPAEPQSVAPAPAKAAPVIQRPSAPESSKVSVKAAQQEAPEEEKAPYKPGVLKPQPRELQTAKGQLRKAPKP